MTFVVFETQNSVYPYFYSLNNIHYFYQKHQNSFTSDKHFVPLHLMIYIHLDLYRNPSKNPERVALAQHARMSKSIGFLTTWQQHSIDYSSCNSHVRHDWKRSIIRAKKSSSRQQRSTCQFWSMDSFLTGFHRKQTKSEADEMLLWLVWLLWRQLGGWWTRVKSNIKMNAIHSTYIKTQFSFSNNIRYYIYMFNSTSNQELF